MANLTNSAKLIEEMEKKAYKTELPTVNNATVTVAVNGNTGTNSFTTNQASNSTLKITVGKSDVGLGNVDNTSDADKPISTATQTALDGKQATISDLSTIRTGAGKGATAVQPGDNISTLTNNSGFITKAVNDLTNYYTKTDTYTKTEVNSLVQNFQGYTGGNDILISGGELPSGYTQLEYAQSDGTFGIDTGWLYDGTSDLKLEGIFMGTAYIGAGACPFGLQNVGYSNWIYPFYGESTTVFTYWGNLSRWEFGYYHLNQMYTVRIYNEANVFWREINGVKQGVDTYDKTTVSTTAPLFIFSGGVGTTATNGFAGKIYSLKIWKAGALDLNLIPAKRNSDNAIGMYDVVGGNFFTHSSLVAGPVAEKKYSINAMNTIIDDGVSTLSQNPVQNKVITSYVNNLVGDVETLLAAL